jgi:hypothetical protein
LLIIIILILALVIFAYSRRKKSYEEPITPSIFESEESLVDAEESGAVMFDSDETKYDEKIPSELEEPLETEDLESENAGFDYECPDCGANLSEDDDICSNCGAEFEA